MFISDLVFGKTTIPVAAEVINMTEVRHKEIVNNIANSETPYYKARDINVPEFREVLGKAIEARKVDDPWRFRMHSGSDIQAKKSGYDLNMRSVSAITDGQFRTGFKVLKRKDDTVMRHDQNNVTMEGEMSRLAKNAALHRTYFTIMKHKFQEINSAIRMRV